jgi:hypothetical protein
MGSDYLFGIFKLFSHRSINFWRSWKRVWFNQKYWYKIEIKPEGKAVPVPLVAPGVLI